jgi:kinesin family protein C2/C3
LKEQGVDLQAHEAASHVIATLKIVSTNIATGVGTQGKIQFVEFAGADLASHRSSGKNKNPKTNDNVLAPVGNRGEWKYANRSMAAVMDVVLARAQFNRSVPYRNSTITHLLQDALEGDAKVMMLLCVSSDPKDMQETASALRFASKMKRVNIGKATKHAILR